MNQIEKYLCEIGIATYNEMMMAIYNVVLKRLGSRYDIDHSKTLAASVANYLFSQTPQSDIHKAFLRENTRGIEDCLRELSTDDGFCSALTCAVYNYCYARYLRSGRRMGLLIHPYLRYVTAINSCARGEANDKAAQCIAERIGYDNVAPFTNLLRYSLYRPLPAAPDSKQCHRVVADYATRNGVTLTQ